MSHTENMTRSPVLEIPNQIRVVREKAGLLDAFEIGVSKVSGKDAADFLHRQLSNEIQNLSPGQGTQTCFLSPQGRILLYFWLWKTEDGYRAIVPGKQRDEFFPLLDRFLFTEDVSIDTQTESLSRFILVGPKAGEILESLSDGLLKDLQPGEAETLPLPGGSLDVYSFDWLEVPVYFLAGPVGESTKLVERILELGVQRVEWEAFHSLRCEKGTPWPEFEVDDKMIPYECGLDEAVSLTKGCYVGQEIIARMHNLGKPPRQLRALVLETSEIPDQGAPVCHEETEVGKILTAAFSDRTGSAIATSAIRRKFCGPGTKLNVGGTAATVEAFPIAGKV